MSIVVVHVSSSHSPFARLVVGTGSTKGLGAMAGPVNFRADSDVIETRLPVLLHHLAATVMTLRRLSHLPSAAAACCLI